MHQIKLTITIALIWMTAQTASWAAEPLFESARVRSGFSEHPAKDRFVQTELYGDVNLPWSWAWGQDWRWHSQLEVSTGWLRRQRADAFVGSLGPQLCLRRTSHPFELAAGISLTHLSQRAFGDWDLGSPTQFTSHVDLRWKPGRNWELGYRVQHLSNGGISHPNPGLNLHMFLVNCRF